MMPYSPGLLSGSEMSKSSAVSSMGVSSGVVSGSCETIVGASSTGVTVTTKVVCELRAPSVTVSVIVAVPYWLAAGVILTIREAPVPVIIIFTSGTSVLLLELPLTNNDAAPDSASPTVNGIDAVGRSSGVDCGDIALMVGASLIGVTITVRSSPVPSTAILAFGTKFTSLELPVTVKAVGAVSGSLTLNAIAGVGVLSLV